MTDLINIVLNGDLAALLGDLYVPVLAAVAASWAIIGFASVAQAFSYIFLAVFNMRGRK